MTTQQNEIEQYRLEPAVPYRTNPLSYWRERKHLYPNIAMLARLYLAIPATSAASERVFSSAGNIITKKRSSLAPENACDLIFAHQNKKYL